MELTNDHLEVAYSAWVAAQSGGGIALDDPRLYPAAVEFAEQGWLERRFVTEPGKLSWWWTSAAETALNLSALVNVSGRRTDRRHAARAPALPIGGRRARRRRRAAEDEVLWGWPYQGGRMT
jgi:hypothetical protein